MLSYVLHTPIETGALLGFDVMRRAESPHSRAPKREVHPHETLYDWAAVHEQPE